MNVYKEAAKLKLVFQTNRGMLTVAGLFDLPLSADLRSKPDLVTLDGLYSELMADKQGFNANSYLGNTNNKELAVVDIKLALLKDVMDTKMAELSEANSKAKLATKRKALLTEMATRVAAAPTKLTDEQLTAALAEVEAELA